MRGQLAPKVVLTRRYSISEPGRLQTDTLTLYGRLVLIAERRRWGRREEDSGAVMRHTCSRRQLRVR